MSEGLKIALTALLGVGVFVVGQLVQRLLIEPAQEQRKLKGKVAHALTYYRNAMPRQTLELASGTYSAGMGPDELREVSRALRALASELRASSAVIPFYRTMSALHFVESTKAVENAADGLMLWSNSVGDESGHTRDACRQIEAALRLQPRG